MADVRGWLANWATALSALCLSAAVVGCASPASPRPPSLHIPEVVTDLSAVRSGDAVQLRFTAPTRTTDGQALAGIAVLGSLCRQEAAHGPCRPVALPPEDSPLPVAHNRGATQVVLWTDRLPADLRSGAPQVLVYRLTLRNAEGRSAGPSDPAYTVSGAAPAPVENFSAKGARPGILLEWAKGADSEKVLIERVQTDATAPNLELPARPTGSAQSQTHPGRPTGTPHRERSTAEPGVVWLEVAADPGSPGATIDSSAVEGVRYRYIAFRERTITVGGRSLALRSFASSPADVTWRDIYPPAAPQGLTALGYAAEGGPADHHGTPESRPYAVDLIWQPGDDPRVTGYLVSRETLDAEGKGQGPEEDLTRSPVTTPAFHDQTATAAKSYRYLVRAVDAKGNRSEPATATVAAQVR